MNFARAAEYPSNPSAAKLSAKSCIVATAGNVLTMEGGAPAIPEGRIWIRAVVWLAVAFVLGAAATGAGCACGGACPNLANLSCSAY
jgi:hypothetical protein